MSTATHPRRATPELPVKAACTAAARTPAVVQAVALTLLDGALERIALGRRCLRRGSEPTHHLRIATLQIREAIGCLALGAEAAIAANLGDLADYMCRQLGAAAAHELTALANVCDLLRELRCAYLPPAAAPRAADALAGAATRM
ncbi:MAG TPA: flagellar protein FliS [Candidatus Dormibacteraeota bacterium]|nr:flagellar protein FliS [Candidatus Dormibacteraeota bacterium]